MTWPYSWFAKRREIKAHAAQQREQMRQEWLVRRLGAMRSEAEARRRSEAWQEAASAPGASWPMAPLEGEGQN